VKYLKPLLLILLILVADQILKIWVKNNMYYGQEIHVIGNWFLLHFTENNGIAFGIQFGGVSGKIALTIFRIIAAGAIFYLLLRTIRLNYPNGFNASMGMIFAGATGNIIDSIFYGKIFGYAPFFQGRVVDMFYFPIIQGHYPQWVPFIGGNYFIFFRPVFNLSDAFITIGVLSLLIFYTRWLKKL